MKSAPNAKRPVLLLQSCEICWRGLLAPGAHADRLPVPSDPQLCGTAHGGDNRWTNGHEQQQRQHRFRGLGATSHQAPCRHQRRAVQKAYLPHELQAARTSENEFMTLGSPADIRTCQGPPFSLFYCLVSKRRVEFSNIDNVSPAHRLFQQSLASSSSRVALGVLTTCRYSAVGWVMLPKKKKKKKAGGAGSVYSPGIILTGALWGLTLENITLFFFVVVLDSTPPWTEGGPICTRLFFSSFFFFNLSISFLQLLDKNSTINTVYVLHFCFRKQHIAFTGACSLGRVELKTWVKL